MAEPHVVKALIRKYQEVAGKIKVRKEEVTHLKSDLDVLVSAIRLFKRDWDESSATPRRPRRKLHDKAKRGAYIRTAIEILREATKPMSIWQIGTEVAKRQGIKPVKENIYRMAYALRNSLKDRVKSGVVAVDKNSHPCRYSIIVLEKDTSHS